MSREGRAEWAHALAGGLSVCRAEGSVARMRHCARGGDKNGKTILKIKII